MRNRVRKYSRGTRTRNLLLRREAPYPLGHTSCSATFRSRLAARGFKRTFPINQTGNQKRNTPPPTHRYRLAACTAWLAMGRQRNDPGRIGLPRVEISMSGHECSSIGCAVGDFFPMPTIQHRHSEDGRGLRGRQTRGDSHNVCETEVV